MRPLPLLLRVGSVVAGLASVAAAIPLAWAGWLLVRQINKAHELDLFTVMIGKGAGGTPGIQHSATSVLAMTATVAIFAGLSAALAHYGTRQIATADTRTRNRPSLEHRILDAVEKAWTPWVAVLFVLSVIPFWILTSSASLAAVLALVVSLGGLSKSTGILNLARFQ